MAAKWYLQRGLRRNSVFNWFLREADFAPGRYEVSRTGDEVRTISEVRHLLFNARDISRHDQPD